MSRVVHVKPGTDNVVGILGVKVRRISKARLTREATYFSDAELYMELRRQLFSKRFKLRRGRPLSTFEWMSYDPPKKRKPKTGSDTG